MHDCDRVQHMLLDLLFNELDSEQRIRALAELENCPVCREHYRSLTHTLDVFDETVSAMAPAERYWTVYEARLQRRLAQPETREVRRAPRMRRLWSQSIRVPVPAAAAFTLLLLMTSLLAMRGGPQPIAVEPPPTPLVVELPRIVQVPVVQEKVVKRIVYAAKKAQQSDGAAVLQPFAVDPAEPSAAQQAPEKDGGDVAGSSLEGFRPASDLKIRIIKVGKEYER